ncbi:hypothetical protein KPL39_14850 [Clostridium gasigenes]|uniref:hypothetical protein n=1 Tax=Clostridium gasigenes TaxID=94869 RepID=UPI001C0B89A6|nr:hypothetical protein [Clostridium gasigenes]MBU3137543.1 hypothetical protein [Clostridium gasigenes]
MKGKKFLINVVLILLNVLMFTGCKNVNNKKPQVNIFNPTTAMDIAKSYLENISKGELTKANDLCIKELLNENKVISTGTSKIVAYNVDNLIESTNSVYVVFNVLRSSNTQPKCDLDSFAIKVDKLEDDYKITEVKAVNKKQVFVKNNGLRITENGAGDSQLIVSLNNMPKDVYPRENKVMLYKEIVPLDEFGTISLSYTGQKIAISTVSKENIFIAIGYLDEGKVVQGSIAGQSSNEAGSSQELQELLDKPIVKKVVPVDLLKDVKIQNFIFSQEEDELIVEYIEKSGVKRIKIYKTEDGTIANTKIDTMFSAEKYNVVLDGLDKKAIYINVSAIEGKDSINKELLGTYKLDLEKLEMTKK